MGKCHGSRIKVARESAGLTQKDLSVECGVTLEVVRGWEANGCDDLEIIAMISDLTGLHIGFFREYPISTPGIVGHSLVDGLNPSDCEHCYYYRRSSVVDKKVCKRFPVHHESEPFEWCGEFDFTRASG